MGWLVGAPEVPVGLVEDERHTVRLGEVVERLDGRPGKDGAGGVPRRHEHDGPGAVGDERRCDLDRGLLRLVGRQVAGNHPFEPHPHVVVEVVGDGDDDLVARHGQRRQRRTERLVASGGYLHVLGTQRLDRVGCRQPVITTKLVGERGAEFGQTGGGRVAAAVGRAGHLGDSLGDDGSRRVAGGSL